MGFGLNKSKMKSFTPVLFKIFAKARFFRVIFTVGLLNLPNLVLISVKS